MKVRRKIISETELQVATQLTHTDMEVPQSFYEVSYSIYLFIFFLKALKLGITSGSGQAISAQINY